MFVQSNKRVVGSSALRPKRYGAGLLEIKLTRLNSTDTRSRNRQCREGSTIRQREQADADPIFNSR